MVGICRRVIFVYMDNQTKNCQNCKNDFIVEVDDFSFYEKMKVPSPTFCPECRMQRRMMFRNGRSLYKRNCDLCGEEFISSLAPNKPYVVYCPKCWFSDKWDPLEFALDYDPNKKFFDQLKELFLKTPHLGKIIDYATVIDSPYTNHIGSAKNCTLVFNSDFCENVLYSSVIVHSKDSMDSYMVDRLELCYEVVDVEKSSKCFFCKSVYSCIDTIFSRDCVGCINCFACCNLRNKSYCAFNRQYTKEEYEKLLKTYNLDTYSGVKKAIRDSEEFFLIQPKRCLYTQNNLNVIGDHVFHSKNSKYCWSGQFFEDCVYCQFCTLPSMKGCYDVCEWGNNAENCIDSITVGEGATGIKYSFSVWSNVRDVEYSLTCEGAMSDCFGCVSLRKKQYCILNKQYTKEEYFKLREQIIKSMNEDPYVDIAGRVWKYGEFIPYDLSLYDYNECFAYQFFPLNKEEVIEKGFTWRDIPKSNYETTISSSDLPDSIKNIPDSILKEVVKCAECEMAYKILLEELNLLRRFSLPLPRTCHNCRHQKRINKVGSPKLYDRNCAKCEIVMKTSYSPDRPEIVYCEKCYQQEVY